MWAILQQRQFLPLFLAIILVVVALFKPSINLARKSYNFTFIIDITQSMNARDYHIDGLPADRLSFSKQSIRQALQDLPCHSKVGIGLFTTKNVFLLFEPLEICKHYHVIEDSLMKIDWRMAWAADSHIARGVFTSIRSLNKIDSQPMLVFMSDGQQTPSISKQPKYSAKIGQIDGLLVGVGNLQPVPVPKYNKNHIQEGYWQLEDAEVMSDQTRTGNFLTSVHENDLRKLAVQTGLQYLHLTNPKQFSQALLNTRYARKNQVATDISWIFAGFGLAFFIGSYFLGDTRRAQN